jgi:predicted lipoprotein with Yx(FWY)xxD motif
LAVRVRQRGRATLTVRTRGLHRARTAGIAAVCVGLAGSLSGCGSSAPTGPTVHSVRIPGIGRVLADRAGYTLYIYLPDQQGRSRCVSVCAKQWPPLDLGPGVRTPTAGPGVDAGLLGTRRRPGGGLQVTYNGWPLYTFIADGPGTVQGQGAGMGAWYTVAVSGSVDKKPPAD